MKTIILAAGKGERFAKEGWAKPKLMLPMPDKRVLLEWMIEKYDVCDGILAMREQDHPSLKSVLQRSIYRSHQDQDKDKPNSFSVAFVNHTVGPLDTMWALRRWIHSTEPLLVVYSDILPMPPYEALQSFTDPNSNNADARMVVFESDNPRFTDAEMLGFKQSGIYWFRNGKQMKNAVRYLQRGESNGMPDVWKIYDADKRREMAWPNGWLADLGTPNDYRNWMAKQGLPVTKDWEIWK